jgi:hypothetical protein
MRSVSVNSRIGAARAVAATAASSSGPVASEASCNWAGWLIVSPNTISEAATPSTQTI